MSHFYYKMGNEEKDKINNSSMNSKGFVTLFQHMQLLLIDVYTLNVLEQLCII